MPQREYKWAAPERGRKDRTLLEIAVDDVDDAGERERTPFLSVPGSTQPEVLYDVADALRKAYRAGREDMAPENPAPKEG